MCTRARVNPSSSNLRMSNPRLHKTINGRFLALSAVLAFAAVFVACGSTEASPTESPTSPTNEPEAVVQPSPTATTVTPVVPTPTQESELSVPAGLDVEAFEELNPRPELRALDRSIDLGFDEREALPRDLINPIYSPKFVSPDEVAELMIENELVMGLNIDGDVRAYPVGIMRFREIVNDEVGGIPLLVTW